MSALTLGLIAAFMWGFHDICVRFVSQKTPLMASLLMVISVGFLFQLTLIIRTQAPLTLPKEALYYAIISGLFFLVASLGLYGAFQRGPVKLVSPIIASFPILSVGWAAARGTHVSALEWLAVLLVIAGVSIVAALSDDATAETPPRGKTILYSVIASIGFAGTFAIGQLGSEIADEGTVTLFTRITAIILLVVGMLALKLEFWPGKSALLLLTLMGLADGIALYAIISAGGMEDAQYASLAASTFGLLTIVLAWIFLKEKMTGMQWFGCAITFAAIGYLAV